MLGSFWDAVAGKLADRWAGVTAPALVFWAGGVLSWAFAGSGLSRLSEVTDWLNKQSGGAQVAALLGPLIVVVTSVIVVQRLATPALRMLEGHWPRWLSPVTARRRRQALQLKWADDEAWQQLQLRLGQAEPTREQRADLSRLEHRRRCRPVRDDEILPTRVGNILRAAETRPHDRYGLDAIIFWPRLWMVLPEPTRSELTSARNSLDASVAAVIWGMGFTAFTPLAWWAAPVGLVMSAAIILWWVPARAEVFANLVESAYDLYRSGLYRHLRWPLPDSPADEYEAGRELTKYLDRGSDAPHPGFTAPP